MRSWVRRAPLRLIGTACQLTEATVDLRLLLSAFVLFAAFWVSIRGELRGTNSRKDPPVELREVRLGFANESAVDAGERRGDDEEHVGDDADVRRAERRRAPARTFLTGESPPESGG